MGLILLVRHAQASAGALDYDVLSELGEYQARLLGSELVRRGVQAPIAVSGALRRQCETARIASAAAGWSRQAQVRVDTAWNEFDLSASELVAAGVPGGPDHRAGQEPDSAVVRWSSGQHDDDYAETFTRFAERVERGFGQLVDGLGPGQTALAFTSAGVIAWVASMLIGAGEPQWRVLKQVAVNTGITRIVVGRREASLIAYNEHTHLDGAVTTYR